LAHYGYEGIAASMVWRKKACHDLVMSMAKEPVEVHLQCAMSWVDEDSSCAEEHEEKIPKMNISTTQRPTTVCNETRTLMQINLYSATSSCLP
jgi:hypothetical protein